MSKLDMAIAIADYDHRYPKYLGTEWFIRRLRELMAMPKDKVREIWLLMFEQVAEEHK